MNTSTIARSANAAWLRRSIAAMGMLLLGGIIALGLAAQLPSKVELATPRAASLDAGRERFSAMKDRQAEARDTTFVPAPAQHPGRERFVALKDRQAELRDGTIVPTTGWSRVVAWFVALQNWVARLP